jgi:beta-galactosidase
MIPKWLRGAGVAAALILLCISSAFAPAGSNAQDVAPLRFQSPRSVVSLDAGWKFHPMRGFQLWPPESQLTDAQINRLHSPAPGRGWLPVQLPDDYVVKGDISREPNASLLVGGGECLPGGRQCGPPKAPNAAKRNPRLRRSAYGGHGYLPVYPAWYRRSFFIPASASGRVVWLDFGGIYRDAVVFVNGHFAVQHPSGYTGFRLNVTSHIHFGADNEVAVFVDPRWFEGWFYEGGGIYRHVRLIITNKLQVAPWGTFVTSKVPGPIHYGSAEGDQAAANLAIQTTVVNDLQSGKKFSLESRIIDPGGKVIASTSSSEELAAGEQRTFEQHVELKRALLWSLEHPNLYRLATMIRAGNSAVDGNLTTFGIRTIRFDPDRGFFLNGKHVEIQGACNHQDFPGVGIAVPDNLWAWRIAKLKAMGANAYRCAHNPTAEAFYRAADRMGMLVMDENRHLGDTYSVKTATGTPYSDLSDLKWMILAHRNHPSIIMWSLCNEERLQRTVYGAKIFSAMKAAVDKIDPTRPTTSAMNGGYTQDGFISVEGILGMNYHNLEFAKIHAEYPHLMIYGSEDINSKTSRGTVTSSPETGLCAEYGCWLAPEGNANGGMPWNSWFPVMENSFVAGEFEWTGFDYRGEPNPFSWPAVTSQVGAMDLSGFPKPAYYYWKAWWEQKPSVYIFPSWNFPKTMDGKSILVRAYSNCGQVELLLNGKNLGEKDMPLGKYLEWHVPYSPGVLSARGYDRGQLVAEYTTQTTGPAVALRLSAEVRYLAANGEAVAPIEVKVVDAEGRVVPDADNLIRFAVSGSGKLAGVANGNPASPESNVASQRKAFRGLCMVLVRASNHPGAITVTAHAVGLKPARIVIHTGPPLTASRNR